MKEVKLEWVPLIILLMLLKFLSDDVTLISYRKTLYLRSSPDPDKYSTFFIWASPILVEAEGVSSE